MLRPLQGIFPSADYPDLLIGLAGRDDAAVYRLSPDQALIVTTDFFTPVVDTPYEYGAIAATNSLSDVYAMGGRPVLALNIAAFPPQLPPEFMAEILRGGAAKAREAGAVIAGGHTLQDPEPKYGLVVIGFAHPERLLTKAGARQGEALVLTKPLGTGVITTALKNQTAEPEHLRLAIEWMSCLNREAMEVALEFDVHGATDISGFGLLGHGVELAEASGAGLRIHAHDVPWMEGAQQYAAAGNFPGGTHDNAHFFGKDVSFLVKMSEEERLLFFDAQTSGGLLLSVPRGKLARFLDRARDRHQPAWVIGEVIRGRGIEVT